ncbi:MAG: head GIN domain-containing protein [Bacteroidota bacterium]
MRKFFRILFYVALVGGAFVFFTNRFEQKNAVPGEDERSMADFHGIDVHGAFDISFTPGKKYNLHITSSNIEAIEDIKSEVKNGILHLSQEGKIFGFRHAKINVEVSGPTLDWLNMSGASNFTTLSPIETEKLLLNLSGAGNVHIEGDIDVLTGRVSGAGNIAFKGEGETAFFDLSGIGNIDAAHFEADQVRVSVSGAGNASVKVNEKLDASVSGAGNVYYTGNVPDRNVSKSASGMGSVRRK